MPPDLSEFIENIIKAIISDNYDASKPGKTYGKQNKSDASRPVRTYGNIIKATTSGNSDASRPIRT